MFLLVEHYWRKNNAQLFNVRFSVLRCFAYYTLNFRRINFVLAVKFISCFRLMLSLCITLILSASHFILFFPRLSLFLPCQDQMMSFLSTLGLSVMDFLPKLGSSAMAYFSKFNIDESNLMVSIAISMTVVSLCESYLAIRQVQ